MDKELLRIVIIATGLIIITGMLAWAYLKNARFRRSLEDMDDEIPVDDELPLHQRESIDESDFSPIVDLDAFDAAEPSMTQPAVKTGRYQEPELEEAAIETEDGDDEEPEQRFVAPTIIQFSVVANQDEGFNGLDLANAFEIVGLEYGNLKIYERLDSKRLVDFGVASMLPPGTFPEQDLETYFCPGLIFFMQPGELEEPDSVFDDFVHTAVFMATELDGTVLDHEHKPLTEKTVELLRRSL